MPEYLAPGVYVEEIEIGGKPIEGVGTSTAGFLGETERGPVTPTLVSGFAQFLRLYGDYSWPGQTRSAYLPYAVQGFFDNGGKRCFIGRIASESPPATLKVGLDGGKSLTINANGPGIWGRRVGVTIEKATVAAKGEPPPILTKLFKMTVEYWSDAAPDGKPEGKPDAGPGKPEPGKPDAGPGKPEPGKPDAGPGKPEPGKPDNPKVQGSAKPAVQEVFDNVSPDPASSDFYVKRINAVSCLIQIANDDGAASGVRPKDMSRTLLQGSDDLKDLRDTSFQGKEDMGARTGLNAFGEIDEIAIVAAPNDPEVAGLTSRLVTHCENLKDRVAVLDVKLGTGKIDGLYPPVDSKYAAVYYPWIKIIDPDTGIEKLIPPSGHVTGIYARSDVERGVHKAPANEVVRGAVGLEFALTKGDQDLSTPGA